MNTVNPFWGFITLLVTFIISLPFAKRYGSPLKTDRYISIDGLRGYLAFFVFLHHSVVWYFYLRTNEWKLPPSNFYTHCGQSSVVLFFMITGFLFFLKLFKGRSEPINWLRLYVSRFFRIVPVYIFFSFILFIIVAILSDFTLKESICVLIANSMEYLAVGLLGTPELNTVIRTALIFSDVTWILKWEWFFYFSLPMLAILVRNKPPMIYTVLSTIIIALGFVFLDFSLKPYIRYFSGGVLAAILSRYNRFRSSTSSTVGAVIILSCICVIIMLFKTTTPPALCLLATLFSIIASGNTLFGLLSNRVARWLGEMSYSIYLFHGFILFIAFKFIIGFERAALLTPLEHWVVVNLCACVLIPVSFLITRMIEAPFMRVVPNVTTWIENRVRISYQDFRFKYPQ